MKTGLENKQNDPHKSLEQISKVGREKIFQTKKSWQRTRMIWEESKSRSWEMTR